MIFAFVLRESRKKSVIASFSHIALTVVVPGTNSAPYFVQAFED